MREELGRIRVRGRNVATPAGCQDGAGKSVRRGVMVPQAALSLAVAILGTEPTLHAGLVVDPEAGVGAFAEGHWRPGVGASVAVRATAVAPWPAPAISLRPGFALEATLTVAVTSWARVFVSPQLRVLPTGTVPARVLAGFLFTLGDAPRA